MFSSGSKTPTPPPERVKRWERLGDVDSSFGCVARDSISGFSGRITGHARYISGCSQVLLIPPVDKDGKVVEGAWYDEQRVEVQVEDRVVLDNARTPGCDMPAPIR